MPSDGLGRGAMIWEIRVLTLVVLLALAPRVAPRWGGLGKVLRFADKYLFQLEGAWYLDCVQGGNVVRKIVGRGRKDARGRHRAVCDKYQEHAFSDPPPEFLKYLANLPLRYNPNQLTFNGTDFLVRRSKDADWQSIVLHGVGSAGEDTLHMFDKYGMWYKHPNITELREYLERVPKTFALCNNQYAQANADGSWSVRSKYMKRTLKNLTHHGDFVAKVLCSNGKWYVIKNPSLEVKKGIADIPLQVWDPYNLTEREALIYYPNTSCTQWQTRKNLTANSTTINT